MHTGTIGHGLGASEVDAKYIALTYDDEPDPEVTARVRNVPKENEAKTTFFVLGDLIASHEQIIKRMDAESHELGHCTLSYARLTEFDGAAVP